MSQGSQIGSFCLPKKPGHAALAQELSKQLLDTSFRFQICYANHIFQEPIAVQGMPALSYIFARKCVNFLRFYKYFNRSALCPCLSLVCKNVASMLTLSLRIELLCAQTDFLSPTDPQEVLWASISYTKMVPVADVCIFFTGKLTDHALGPRFLGAARRKRHASYTSWIFRTSFLPWPRSFSAVGFERPQWHNSGRITAFSRVQLRSPCGMEVPFWLSTHIHIYRWRSSLEGVRVYIYNTGETNGQSWKVGRS